MSAILRAPQIVPSLFSRTGDGDEPAPRRMPLLERLSFTWTGWRSGWQTDAAMARYISLLAGPSIVLMLIGKPLLKAASLHW